MYRDPETGAIGVPPPGAAAQQLAPRALESENSAAAQGLTVEPGGPAGGVKIKLNGRIRAAVVRHAGDGEVGGHECVETRVSTQ